MCFDKEQRNDIPATPGWQVDYQAKADAAGLCNEKLREPEPRVETLRDRLERKRTRLQRQLAQIDAALQVLYTVPQAEQIAAILQQV